jgi:hypothetical protein
MTKVFGAGIDDEVWRLFRFVASLYGYFLTNIFLRTNIKSILLPLMILPRFIFVG